jgi:hypothetical protein
MPCSCHPNRSEVKESPEKRRKKRKHLSKKIEERQKET